MNPISRLTEYQHGVTEWLRNAVASLRAAPLAAVRGLSRGTGLHPVLIIVAALGVLTGAVAGGTVSLLAADVASGSEYTRRPRVPSEVSDKQS